MTCVSYRSDSSNSLLMSAAAAAHAHGELEALPMYYVDVEPHMLSTTGGTH